MMKRTCATCATRAMAAVAEDLSAQTLLTGHSAQDQTETVFAGLVFAAPDATGLCGMPQRRTLSAHVDLVRPLFGARPREFATVL